MTTESESFEGNSADRRVLSLDLFPVGDGDADDAPVPRSVRRREQGPTTALAAAAVLAPPSNLLQRVNAEVDKAGGELKEDPEGVGSIGRTMFDLTRSDDETVTVVLPRENIQK